MAAGGYVKLTRCLIQKPIFQNEKLLKVWIWCLLKASHKEHEQLIGLQKINLQPGQFITGRYAGAKELKMNPSTFWKYLLWLNNNQSLDIQSNNKFSLVTLINWELYQIEPPKSDSKNDSKMTTKEQQNNTNKNVKNGKNENNNIYSVETIPFREIIDYLNQSCGTSYRVTEKHKTSIRTRWQEKYTFDDFKKVIEKKAKEWLGTDSAKYLRPETLFGTKFDSYLNQLETEPKVEIKPVSKTNWLT
ncbi:conserved phage C-terminal domain-containing protein [Sporomusa sphaeroides]|uniref:Phage conserved hypothetical protein C-terminal domain-containing protein n=1 Tax=Sporomusa sphaeroides DSM 2875 TaxID=1337886 RepID=A0ABM9VXP4_9FIRM|nr:conserved phage C-terminal domain-containing protein [Sporomusa sphaeroides]OLS58264.1 hypothetical protein SPSPH_18000 [Sporomusa sphaeroides DSM 2875]CVK17549.1 hypothetical protein SSPH_00183 [Sporomusa sphaeroides DSM 2875]